MGLGRKKVRETLGRKKVRETLKVLKAKVSFRDNTMGHIPL